MSGKTPKKVIRWLDLHFEETLMIIFGSLIGIIIMMQIIMRYFFHNALSWPEEFCRFCYIYFCFISIGYSVRNHCLLNVTLLQDFLPRAVRMALDVLIQLTMLVVFGVFFMGSITCVQAAAASHQMSTAMQIPMYIPYMATCIGFLIATLRSVQAVVRSIRMTIRGEDIKVDAVEAVKEELSESDREFLNREGKEN